MIVMKGERELFEGIDALDAAGGFTGGLYGRQQKSDQDRDDRDHDQKLDEGKTVAK